MRALIRHWRAAVLVLLYALLAAVAGAMHWAGINDTGVYMLMGALLCASQVPDAWRRGRDG
ncbi:hypothetical protein [Stenotrophomonas sp. Marseille-Q5258]|uniref:hypothetical protein n=1 Tax=Stenotrophomonas sp. Marseille-Q5258 TaxID=2972779 RepID=UPI0021CA3E6B|nr:hypothetical protein [Stenotrophomonas sp. Marseille-Q5258]